MHRIGQKQARERMARGFLFGFHCGITQKLRFTDERQERQHQLVQRRHAGMREYHGALGVDPARKVIDHHVQHVVVDVLGGVAVGDDLVVGDDDVGLHAFVLQAHAFDDGAEEMPKVQPPGRPVAREHGVCARVSRQVGLHCIAHLLLLAEGIGIARHETPLPYQSHGLHRARQIVSFTAFALCPRSPIGILPDCGLPEPHHPQVVAPAAHERGPKKRRR